MSFTTIYSTFRLLYASFTIEVFPDVVIVRSTSYCRAANNADCIHDLYYYRGLDRIKRVRKKQNPTIHQQPSQSRCLQPRIVELSGRGIWASLLAAGGSLKCLLSGSWDVCSRAC